MDADGLPLIGPSVNYEKVAPINQKKTVEYLNHFIIHTAGFLNQFSTVCEEKLASLSARIERLNIQMTLLEGKINSVPGLQNLSAGPQKSANQQLERSTADTTASEKTAASQSETASKANQSQLISDTKNESQSAEPQVKDKVDEEQQPTNTVSQDPRYMKYFKMLNFGVPAMAVKQKMAVEGLDPDLLDNPSAPLPGSNTVANSSSPTVNNDDDFSDEDEVEEQSSDSSVSFSD